MNRKQRRAEGKSGKVAAPAPIMHVEDRLFQNALFHHQSGHLREAEAGYREVLARDARHSGALCHLGMLANDLGHRDDAIALMQKAIASDKRNPHLHFNLGIIFEDAGRREEAIQQYRKVIALKPDYAEAFGSLSALLLINGNSAEALAIAISGLKVEETKSLKTAFTLLTKALDPTTVTINDDFIRFLARALTGPWARPRDLLAFAIAVLMRDPFIARAASRISGSTIQRPDEIFTADELEVVDSTGLLNAIIITAPVTFAPLEHLLTTLRRALLNEVCSDAAVPEHWLPLASSIACQCYINEYVFEETEAETEKVFALCGRIAGQLERGDALSPIQIAVVASYRSLGSFEWAIRLATQILPESVRGVILQQISEPREELAIRPTIENLTSVTDAVSEQVRAQYEESPYPKWTACAPDDKAIKIDVQVHILFPNVRYRHLGNGPVELLIAGCGTGMQPVERAQQILQANVLAIDLSLSSLSYAIRKTREMGITNIRYAQADILEFRPDRLFDVVESNGVLHHLKNPLDGWRRLASLVRPGGLMRIGLYSSIARRAINAAREEFAKQARVFSPAEARRLRAEILRLPPSDQLSEVTKFGDFFNMSEFRDLLFHIQEHQFSLPQIAGIVNDLNFTFLGLETPARSAYLARFPDDPTAVNLDNWNTFETENPSTFASMYQFWIQKNDTGKMVEA